MCKHKPGDRIVIYAQQVLDWTYHGRRGKFVEQLSNRTCKVLLDPLVGGKPIYDTFLVDNIIGELEWDLLRSISEV